jgi:hypothetical protein
MKTTTGKKMGSSDNLKRLLKTDLPSRHSLLRRKRLSTALMLTLPLFLLAACGGDTADGPIVKDIVSIDIVNANLSGDLYAAGEGTQLSCTVTYTDETTSDVTDDITWESNDTTVATVERGLVQGAANTGSVAITASFQHFNTRDAKVLSIIPLAELNITSDDITIADNHAEVNTTGTFNLKADGTFADDRILDITDYVQWTSSNTTVATVAVTGMLTALAEGSTDINASLYDINATPLQIDVNLTAQ